jgi:beta-lactamase class A
MFAKKKEKPSDIELLLHRVRGTFAVVVQELPTGATVRIRPYESFDAASTIKIPIMIEVYKQARTGKFRLHDSLIIHNQFSSVVDNSPYYCNEFQDGDAEIYELLGAKMSIRDLIHRMITISSNVATNMLLELVGAEQVNATMADLGCDASVIQRGISDRKAYKTGLNNFTTANDLVTILQSLNDRTASDSASCTEMMDILFDQRHHSKIPALLPPDVKVAHKTGSSRGVEHDCGIVVLPSGKRYIIVALSKNLRRQRDGIRTIAKISKKIFDRMSNSSS